MKKNQAKKTNFVNKKSNKIGLTPGSLVHIGEVNEYPVQIELIKYDTQKIEVEKSLDLKSLKTDDNDLTTNWLNINGLHNIDLISEIGDKFKLEALLLEDILNTGHRPKFEEFDNCLFLTFKMLGLDEGKKHELKSEQISLLLGKNWVLCFQEREGDVFDPIRTKLKESKGKLREHQADFLFYRIIDIVVDNYFLITEDNSDIIERLDELVLQDPSREILHKIQKLKRRLLNLRKVIYPLREAISALYKDSYDLIKPEVKPYLKDVYEHVIQVSDTIDTQREIVNGIMDLYLSGVSYKMNQIMQVLTIISTIFIPLTFIAGIYGMNFENIPELHYQYGYHIVWAFMAIITIGMLFYFRKKKWL